MGSRPARLGPPDRRAGGTPSIAVDRYEVGDRLLAEGDVEGALASYDAGLIALEHLAGEQPRDPLRQWEHALGHRKMGAALLARDDAAAAVAALRAALAVTRRIMALEPANPEWQCHVSDIEEEIDNVLRDQRASEPDRRARVEPAVRRFAELLRGRHGVTHVFLFGSRTRRAHGPESDYDLLIVGPCFRNTHPMQRRVGIRDIWQEAGGHGPLDMYCLTPEEFERARQGITLVREVLPEAIEV